MIKYEKGEFAVSKCGHDKASMYVIVKSDDQYVYLVNGKNRKYSNPKKKKHMHVQLIHKIDSNIKQKIANKEMLNDEDIVAAIKKQLNK